MAVERFIEMAERFLRQTLTQLAYVEGREVPEETFGSIDLVIGLCKRFHLMVKQLTNRREGRSTLMISDEYDVQDLMHSMLRLHFDDVRPEEWTPSYAGSASRMDFLLKQEGIVIEVKKTRRNLGATEVANQLTIDVARYREHPDCRVLVCFIYDPDGFIANPRGIESDLAKLSSEELTVLPVIVQ